MPLPLLLLVLVLWENRVLHYPESSLALPVTLGGLSGRLWCQGPSTGSWMSPGEAPGGGGQQAGSRLRLSRASGLREPHVVAGWDPGGCTKDTCSLALLFGSQLVALWGDSWQTGGTIGDARFKPGLATLEAKALSIPCASAPVQMCTFGILSDLGRCLLTESKHAGLSSGAQQLTALKQVPIFRGYVHLVRVPGHHREIPCVDQ